MLYELHLNKMLQENNASVIVNSMCHGMDGSWDVQIAG